MRCPECHAPLTLNINGELVCSQCGLVVDELVISNEVAYKRVLPYKHPADSTNTGSLILLSYKKLNGCSLGQILMYKRFAKLQILAPKFNAYSTYYRAIRELERVTSKFSIPEDVKERAIQLYFKVLKAMSNYKGRLNHFRIIAASLIYSVKEAGISLPIRELLRCFSELGHKVDYSSVMEILLLIKKMNSNHYENDIDVKAYMYNILKRTLSKRRIENEVNIPDERIIIKILGKAMELISSIDRRKYLGRNPYIVALAALYASSLIVLGRRKSRIISQRVLSEVSGFSESAIRTCYKKLFERFVKVSSS